MPNPSNSMKNYIKTQLRKVVLPILDLFSAVDADLDSFESALNNKADANHTHDVSSLINDASTTAKGIVQLSDATNSESSAMAATPKAVKAAYDLAAGKAAASHSHTASDLPDASTSAKGIVQLTTSYTGNSQTLAATQYALYQGLAQKAASSHNHSASDINSGTLDSARLPNASTSAKGGVQLSSVTDSTSEAMAATPAAVKAAYDLAASKLAKEDRVWYGTCDTSYSTQAKVVTCEGFTLKTGSMIRVKFANYNTASSPTLNVNGTGAKYIVINDSSTYATAYQWKNQEVIDFVYDGTYWRMVDGAIADTTYYGMTKLSNSYSSSSQVLAATPYALYNGLRYQAAMPYSGTLTCPAASSWSGPNSYGLYYCDVYCSNLASSSGRVHISPVISTTDTDTGDAQQAAWDTHYYAAVEQAYYIRFYAKEAPTVAVDFNYEILARPAYGY